MKIAEAKKSDCKDILELQYLAYQSEAKLLNNDQIPPLTQTLEEVEEEYVSGTILKAVTESGGIIGSVRGYTDSGTLYIGKLIVHPKHQGNGIGTKLLTHMETMFPHCRCELFTSNKSTNNLRLYEKNGYTPFKEQQVSSTLCFIYLEKPPRI